MVYPVAEWDPSTDHIQGAGRQGWEAAGLRKAGGKKEPGSGHIPLPLLVGMELRGPGSNAMI